MNLHYVSYQLLTCEDESYLLELLGDKINHMKKLDKAIKALEKKGIFFSITVTSSLNLKIKIKSPDYKRWTDIYNIFSKEFYINSIGYKDPKKDKKSCVSIGTVSEIMNEIEDQDLKIHFYMKNNKIIQMGVSLDGDEVAILPLLAALNNALYKEQKEE